MFMSKHQEQNERRQFNILVIHVT